MPDWNANQLLLAQYVLAFLASFFATLCVRTDRTLWQKIGETGKFGILGATIAPIFSATVPMPNEITKAERLLFWAASCGGGTATVPMLRKWIGNTLNGNPTTTGENG